MGTWAHTVLALKRYDATEVERTAMMDAAMTDADIDVWSVAEHAAQDSVRQAFYEDTKAYNSLDNCMLVAIGWLRTLITRWPEGWS